MDTCELPVSIAPQPITNVVQPTATAHVSGSDSREGNVADPTDVQQPIARDYALTGSQSISTVGPQKKTRFVLPTKSKDSVDSKHAGQSNKRKTEPSKQKVLPKQKPPQQRKWRHMVFGYMVPEDLAAERGAAIWGTDRPAHELAYCYVASAIRLSGLMFNGRVNLRLVYVDEKNQNIEFCIALAENTCVEALVLPPQEKINKLKELLETEEPPKWWKFFG